MKKNVLFIFGTRPEAIKLFPLIKIFRESDEFNTIVLNTGQQKEMLDITISSLEILVDYDLGIMTHDQSLANLTAKLLTELDRVFTQILPDYVFILGDPTTSMSAGIVAKYHKLPVFHIEAGLRSNDIYSPWPEEINRKINMITSDYHVAPTIDNKLNLINEGIKPEFIFVTGNTCIDTLKIVLNKNNHQEKLYELLSSYYVKEKSFVLITIHRRENFSKLDEIFNAVLNLANSYKKYAFIYPVHLNPNVYNFAKEKLGNTKNIYLIPPLDYINFVIAISNSVFVITDSGGIQEESTFLGKPVILCRNTTERHEGLKTNNILICGTDSQIIYQNASKLLNDESFRQFHSEPSEVFGDGNSSQRIFEIFKKVLVNNIIS